MIIKEKELMHYGILRRSGRYPWGSGSKSENVRNKKFLDYVDDMRKQGLSDTEIARGQGIPLTQFRAAKTIAKNQQKQSQILMAQRLSDKGNSNVGIGKRMGLPESTVRTLLAPGAKDRAKVLTNTSEMLKRQVAEKKFIDVGTGVESHIGMSKEKLAASVAMLKEQGYEVHVVKLPQATTTHETDYKVLTAPGTKWSDVKKNINNIKQISEISDSGGRSFGKTHEPMSIHPNRVEVKYKDNGGSEADGVIYVRPGIKDVSLGKSNYAQVRVQVGNGHYLKGMAMYKNDLPPGVDLVFNTNKSNTGNKLDAMKPLKSDSELPFGAIVNQVIEDRGGPKERLVSSMNIVNEEGDWTTWSRSLSSQFLSKQSPALAKTQLGITADRRKQEFKEIMALSNPTIKKKLLESFAESTDSSAVQLRAAAISQNDKWHIILPISSIKPNEVYAPNYPNGERVALVRYPHGGTFEIPELTVNNRNPEAKSLLGGAPDAVGIHHTVAQRLSGADFDGDTVIVIPNNKGLIQSSPALTGLKGFDAIAEYPAYPGMVPIGNRKQNEMGKVSNLITDMTIRGAPHSDIVRAIRHSMVVIDAEKHNLDWKSSEQRNGIAQLKAMYQGGSRAGASTLISRSGAKVWVDQRKPRSAQDGGPVDRTTGQRVYVPTGRTKPTANGEVPRQQTSKRMAEITDAHMLSSGTPMEHIYANHANDLKALANTARLAAVNTPSLMYSPSASKTYSSEVASLNHKMKIAEQNRPLERQAQVIAGAQIKAKLDANPGLDSASVKKIKNQAINDARNRVGANKKERSVVITQPEWNAIQAGAISNHKLTQILTNTDLQSIRSFATPHHQPIMSPSNIGRAESMVAKGYTRSEIATQLGVSLTTLNTALLGGVT